MVKIFRKRYLVFHLISSNKNPISSEDFLKTFETLLTRLYGVRGKIRYGIELKYFSEEKQSGIICCYHKALPFVRSLLLFIQYVGENRVLINVFKVTGTFKKALYLLNSHKENIVI